MPNKTLRALAASLISISTAALLTACGGGSEGLSSEIAFAPTEAQGLSREIAFAPIESPPVGSTWEVQSFVARTESQWSQLWNMGAPAAVPLVDFSANTVVGVSLEGPDGCSKLEIPRVIEEPEQIRVEYRLADVPPHTACIQVLVPLKAFIAIPATAKPIIFQQTGR